MIEDVDLILPNQRVKISDESLKRIFIRNICLRYDLPASGEFAIMDSNIVCSFTLKTIRKINDKDSVIYDIIKTLKNFELV